MTSPRLVSRWESAAQKLGFQAETSYRLTLPSGHAVDALVFVKHYGGRAGMLVVDSFSKVKEHIDELAALGYGFSVQGEPSEDAANDPIGLIEVLRDWDWFGPEEQRPAWLDGLPQE